VLSFIGTLKTQNMLSNLIIFLLTSEEAPIIIDIFHLICICFSGDHDMCVPYTGSLAWTTSLGYGVIDSWRPWFVNEQVSGYVTNNDHFVLSFLNHFIIYPRNLIFV
jgi:hypothetical protein